jgi:hypothetical protein
MFGRRLQTCLDLLKPDVRARMEMANFRQKCYHDQLAEMRAFAREDPVWVLSTTGTGHQQGKILQRTGPLSYRVLVNGKSARKHAAQLRFRRIPGEPDHDVTMDEGISRNDDVLFDNIARDAPAPPIEPLRSVPPRNNVQVSPDNQSSASAAATLDTASQPAAATAARPETETASAAAAAPLAATAQVSVDSI